MDPDLDDNRDLKSFYPFPNEIIIEDRESAARYARHILDNDNASTLDRCLVIWVDGSVQSQPVKYLRNLYTAAATCRDFSSKEWKDSITVNITQLGSDTGSSLEAEFLAIQEAFRIACELSDTFDSLLISSDSQPILNAIWARTRFRSLWMKDMAKNIIKNANELYNLGITVELRWVPGHSSIQGNERVDKLAGQFRQLTQPLLKKVTRGVTLKDISIISSSPIELRQMLSSEMAQQMDYGEKYTGPNKRTSLHLDRDPTPHKKRKLVQEP